MGMVNILDSIAFSNRLDVLGFTEISFSVQEIRKKEEEEVLTMNPEEEEREDNYHFRNRTLSENNRQLPMNLLHPLDILNQRYLIGN